VRESERWRKLAEAVHNGEGFVGASIELVNSEEFVRAVHGGRKGNALIYGKAAQKADVLYALLLAEEAEDDELAEEAFDAVIVELKKMPVATVAGFIEFAPPFPAAFAWADPEPFPEEKEDLKPVYIQGYMERRTTWSEKWATFRESVREWVRRTF
jgi:hypothetical protein